LKAVNNHMVQCGVRPHGTTIMSNVDTVLDHSAYNAKLQHQAIFQ